MSIFELLSDAERLVAARWRATQPHETEDLYRLVQEAQFYLHRTGQIYQFEDHLARAPSDRTATGATPWTGEYGEDMQRSREILSRMRDSQQSTDDQNLIQAVIDEIDFIRLTGQQDDFYDYLKTFYRNPPPVIARFGTREEAERWLATSAEPPSSAHVLVGNEYLEVLYSRESGVRSLKHEYTLERFIEAVTSRGLPSPAATFNTLAEAEAWWQSHPAPPLSTFVQIAGEHYLAINHRKIAYRSLHPVSILKGWQEEKKRLEAQQAQEGSSDTDA